MDQFLHRHAGSVTGVLSGFDRMRFRGTLRLIANARGLTALLSYLGVLMKDFKHFALDVSTRVRQAAEGVARAANRPLLYLSSWSADKEAVARQLAARDGIRRGLICVLACVERCQSFDLRSDKAKGLLLVEPAVRKCQHYYFYHLHERFGFMHLRLQSWLPLNVWVCVNGREFLARQMDAAGVGYRRAGNCFTHVDDLPAASRLAAAQLDVNWRGELGGLALAANPLHPSIFAARPLDYYWSLEESEWASDVMFARASDLAGLYPRLVRHGMQNLSCREVMRYLGKRVNADGSVPLNFNGEVLTDLRPAASASAPVERRGVESVRLKHRLNRNWLKMYDKAQTVLRVETVINDPRDMKVYRAKESDEHKPGGKPGRASSPPPRQWLRMRKGVADLKRRAELSQKSNERYLDALAGVEAGVSLGEVAGPVCKRVKYKGRTARGLNPLSGPDAELLEAVGRGEFAINGLRNRDLRARLFGPPSPDPATHKRQSGQVTRRIRLLRAHGLLKKISRTHRYQLTKKGREVITALLTARAADTKQLLPAA